MCFLNKRLNCYFDLCLSSGTEILGVIKHLLLWNVQTSWNRGSDRLGSCPPFYQMAELQPTFRT